MISRIGLAIDPVTNDLCFDETGAMKTVIDAHAVGQHVRQRLMTFKGEWFLDTRVGVPWLDQILGKGFNPALGEAVVKASILATAGVKAISDCSVTFGRATRGLFIRSIEITTDYDEEVKV